MNLKSITKRVSDFVTAVMRSWPPHHKCHTDNEQQQTSNGTQQKDAGEKLFHTYPLVSPQQPDDYLERLVAKLIWVQKNDSKLSKPHTQPNADPKTPEVPNESYKQWRKPTGL